MNASRVATITFVAAVALLGAVVGLATQAKPALGAFDRAMDALVERSGSDCTAGEDILVSADLVRDRISEAKSGAGWVVPDRLYVGAVAEAVQSLRGELVASDDSGSWVLTGAGKSSALYGLHPFKGADKPAYVVLDITRSC
jgi:hypothetical protein